MRIAINVCHDYLRSQWFRRIDLRTTLEELPQRFLTVEQKDVSLTLDVMRLREPLKQVVLLYYYEGMTMEEVSETLGLSKSAVSKRLREAENQLKLTLTGGVNHANE